jgi:type II secretory pathway pseudopilin PulG
MNLKVTVVSSRGFSLVESIVAVLLFVLIALLAARIVMNNTRAIVSTNQNRKAAQLARMVTEQFNNIAATDFYSMATQYHGQSFSPGSFFNTANDDLGFSGFTILPMVSPQNNGVANLTVKINWTQERGLKTATFTKSLYATTSKNIPSGVVDVWVIGNCASALTDPSLCPGLSGFQVTAPNADPNYVNQFNKNESWATTINGHAILRNVKLSSDNGNSPIPIQATKSGSSFNTPAGSCGTGYYDTATGNVGKVIATVNKTVTLAGPNIAIFKTFLPLGIVTGTLSNDDPSGTKSNLGVLLKGKAINGAVLQSNSKGWLVNTDANGTYTFCNVLPSALTITAQGRPGSDPKILTTDPNFLQGYTNPNSYSVTLPAASKANDSAPTLNQPLIVYPIGAVLVKTVQQANTGLTVPNVTVQIQVPPNAAMPTLQYSSYKAKTDVNGIVHLFNLVTSAAPVNVKIDAARAPVISGGYSDQGWAAYGSMVSVQRSASDKHPADNQITLAMDLGYRVVGRVLSSFDHTPLSGVNVTLQGIGLPNPSTLTMATDSNGYFGISGTSLGGAWGLYNPKLTTLNNTGFIPDLPTIYSVTTTYLSTSYNFQLPNTSVFANFLGTVGDADLTSLVIPGAKITSQNGTVSLPNGNSGTIFTDASGNFSLRDTVNSGLNMDQSFPIQCFRDIGHFPAAAPSIDPALAWTCLSVSTNSAGAVTGPQPLYISTMTDVEDTLVATKSCYTQASAKELIKKGATTPNVAFYLQLSNYSVTGKVTDQALPHSPVADLEVCDATLNSPNCTTTNSSGIYTLNAVLLPSSRTSTNNRGVVAVQVVAGSIGTIDGYAYAVTMSSATSGMIPQTPDCNTPLSGVNLSVRKLSMGL